MPQEAMNNAGAERTVPLDQMASAILKLL